MSGGYFGYNQWNLSSMAEEIDNLVENNMNNKKNEWGDVKGAHYPPEIIKRFKEAALVLKKAHIMVNRIDWLMSGDDGEDNFIERWNRELKELKERNRNDRI
jgi:hypothetical protein